MKKGSSGIVDPRDFEKYTKVRGPTPSEAPLKASFWAGYKGIGGPGSPGSAESRAYHAGRQRARVERGLRPD